MTVDRIHKSEDLHGGSFAAPGFTVEDLECDPKSFAPLGAIRVKEAYNDNVAAYEVEEGTCQCAGGGGLLAVIDIRFCSKPNGFICKSGGETLKAVCEEPSWLAAGARSLRKSARPVRA